MLELHTQPTHVYEIKLYQHYIYVEEWRYKPMYNVNAKWFIFTPLAEKVAYNAVLWLVESTKAAEVYIMIYHSRAWYTLAALRVVYIAMVSMVCSTLAQFRPYMWICHDGINFQSSVLVHTRKIHVLEIGWMYDSLQFNHNTLKRTNPLQDLWEWKLGLGFFPVSRSRPSLKGLPPKGK